MGTQAPRTRPEQERLVENVGLRTLTGPDLKIGLSLVDAGVLRDYERPEADESVL